MTPTEPRGREAADLIGLDAIRRQVARWASYDKESRERQGLVTSPDTHIVAPPVWPTHGQLANWVALFDRLLAMPTPNPAEVVGFCWEVNADHPRLEGKQYWGGGERVTLGQRGPTFPADLLNPGRPWGLTQVWIMRNGQEIRAIWKRRP